MQSDRGRAVCDGHGELVPLEVLWHLKNVSLLAWSRQDGTLTTCPISSRVDPAHLRGQVSSRLTTVDQKLLVEAIVSAFMSFEHATDAEVDPDWAVKAMEAVGATLGQLSAEGRSEFKAHLEALASELPDDPFYDRWRNYYHGFPRVVGWEPSLASRCGHDS